MKNTNPPTQTQLANFRRDAAFFLNRHPFCQVFISIHEISEEAVIRGGGTFHGRAVPVATMIHLRHPGAPIADQSWWMAVSEEKLAWIKANEAAAVSLGLLVPEDADPDGHWINEFGNPVTALRTEPYMLKKGRRA